MVAPFNPLPKVDKEQGMTGTNSRKTAKSILPWTAWDSCCCACHTCQSAGTRSGQGMAEAVQEVTQQTVEVAFVDQDYTGDDPKNDAKEAGIKLSCCPDVG